MPYLTIIVYPNASNKNVGDVSACHKTAPTGLSDRKFLNIETDLPQSEIDELLKTGVPDSVAKALIDETTAALAEGRKPDNKYQYFDQDYPYRAKRIDLTQLSAEVQSQLAILDGNKTAFAALFTDAKAAAKAEVIKEVEKHYGRTLTDTEKRKETKEFIEEFTSDNPAIEEKKMAIIAASRKGWKSVQDEALKNVQKSSVVFVDANELRAAII